ncbi:hypothetical protein [Ostreibacterium oceani]|uniref:Uncharacterized protein n=1 Tax=Ostreibacterium oceani TaxID=2654998 RepID=A0A6N7EZA7_9GAMM|nr:hypothetical protein [Ostreibacterium oceani]MPV86890.1 hypothetical protein [Ostreibacterium oceani]
MNQNNFSASTPTIDITDDAFTNVVAGRQRQLLVSAEHGIGVGDNVIFRAIDSRREVVTAVTDTWSPTRRGTHGVICLVLAVEQARAKT